MKVYLVMFSEEYGDTLVKDVLDSLPKAVTNALEVTREYFADTCYEVFESALTLSDDFSNHYIPVSAAPNGDSVYIIVKEVK